MRSPFPCMDPWLEEPSLWPDLHHNLIGLFRRFLVPQLPDLYTTRVERRTYQLRVDDPGVRVAIPDVHILREAVPAFRVGSAGHGVSRPTAVLTMPAGIEFREPRLSIRDRRTKRVVTWIELLSPTNKEAGSHGREIYLAKRKRILRSRASLVEIDLLRRGERFRYFEPLPEGDYYGFVSRAGKRTESEVYAVRLADALPVLPVPLASPDKDVRLDLPEALNRAYAEARYDRDVDYGSPPDPPLEPARMKWARTRISKWNRARNGKR